MACDIGALEILSQPLLGYFCSSRCPGSVILRAYDLARELRDNRIPIISGFHSPIERKCLHLLLRGPQPPTHAHPNRLAASPLPMVGCSSSPITRAVHRPTAEHAATRNLFATTIATAVLIAHAAPGCKIQRLSDTLIQRQQPLLTLDDPANHDLIAHGAQPITAATITPWWTQQTTASPTWRPERAPNG
jgi:hypothetical protein